MPLNSPSDNSALPNEDLPEVNIEVGEIEFEDNATEYVEADEGTVFTDYMLINRYEKDLGVYMMGITSPSGFNGDTVAFAQLKSPTTLWVCDWTAAKAGGQPEAPNPTLGDPRWVLMDQHQDAVQMTVMEDGVTPLFRLTGTYVYGCRRPSANLFSDVVFPRPPWIEDFTTRTYSQSQLRQGLIEQQTSTQGFIVNSPGSAVR